MNSFGQTEVLIFLFAQMTILYVGFMSAVLPPLRFPPVFLLRIMSLLAGGLSSVHAGEEEPTIGAIRWDAWYGQDGPVQSVEATLAPPKYHFRLPWFAKVTAPEAVDIDGNSPEIMEKELLDASKAGLNYWAFVDYGSSHNLSDSMMRAFNLYLDAKDRRGVKFCFIEPGEILETAGRAAWSRLVEYFKHPDYQTVLNGRPLLYIFQRPKNLGKDDFKALGDEAEKAGLKRPYLVMTGLSPEQNAKDMQELGFDAISAYSHAGEYTMTPKSYADMCRDIRLGLWEKCRMLRIPCVTFASAGWDTRPRNERPPHWVTWVEKATPDTTPPAEQKPLIDATTATPAQIEAHFREALEWTRNNRDLNPTNSILIYAWNENDEGGWLIPTLGEDGHPDESRIQAAGRAFRP